jgi:hypothetical protein
MSWWEYQKLFGPGPYFTSADHRIIIKRESIPIVFVPGIMGSRLKRGSDKVWDPNSDGFMAKTYLTATPTERKHLITDPGLEVDVDTSDDFRKYVKEQSLGGWVGRFKTAGKEPSEQNKDFDKANDRGYLAVTQGWGGIAWSFYGKLILALTDKNWDPFDKFFVFPVYAVGYNWVQDNLESGKKLEGRIKEIIQMEASKGLICEKVIVVSHSMGGLVSRAAAKLKGAEGSILGIVHGAQPALGAPAAYRRMRAGFESSWNPLDAIGAWVLGATSQKVMPVLGNSVGALELLPTQLYQTNSGQARWLTMSKDGNVLSVLPENQDPYTSIYEDDGSFLRLAYHPEYLDPGGAKKSEPPDNVVRDSRKAFVKNLRDAKKFHEDLKLLSHGTTYSTWVEGGKNPTWDKIDYTFLQRRYQEPAYPVSPDGMPTSLNPEEGQGIDYWESNKHPEQNGYYSLQDHNGEGDGTVPTSSGSALKGKSVKTKVIKDVEHAAFFNDAGAQEFTAQCIMEIAKMHFDSRMRSCNVYDGK